MWVPAAVLVALCAGRAAAAPARPDLVEAAVVVSTQGATLVVTDRVANRGESTAPRSRTRYVLGGVPIGGRPVPRLRFGTSSRASTRLVVPRSVPAGTFRLLACADGAHLIVESNERNNCRVALGKVEVGDRTPPGYEYVRELERFLRDSQERTLAGTAQAVATALHDRPQLFEARAAPLDTLPSERASDDVTPPDRVTYDVYQANVPGGEDFGTPTYTAVAGATGFTTPPVPDDRTYYFVVRARDSAGNSEANKVERPGRNLCV